MSVLAMPHPAASLLVRGVQTASASAPDSSASNGTSSLFPEGLAVVPGIASGEGCSAEGGCASCPYMKMNTLA